MTFELYREEKDRIASARAALETGAFAGEAARAEFERLLAGYEKLFKATQRLVRISDRNEAELNRLAGDLRVARDAAEAATRAKDVFLATMSHEIRTPMNGVIGIIDLLAHTGLDPDQRKMLGTVRDSAFALLTIINDILDFSKIEAGKMTLEEIPVSIRDVVEGVTETLSATAAGKGIAIEAFVDPDLPDAVLGDEVRLRQILFNLGGNAVKFTAAGGVLVRADRRPGDGGDGRVAIRLSVVDTGIGIPEDAQARLFEAFSQADESTTRRFGGTGLGLSICVRLSELMGGRIDVDSAPGRGSTFFVDLDLPVAADPAPAGDGHDLAGLSVLMAVPGPPLGDLHARYLRRRGAEVTTVVGLDAVAEAAREAAAPLDAIVVEAAEGLDAVAALRGLDAVAAVPFVVSTAERLHGRRPALADTRYVDACPTRRARLVAAVAAATGRAAEDETEAPPPAAERRAPPSPAEAEARGELVLVAEDNPTNQDVIRRQLELLGYAADVVFDGAEALAAWRGKRYAIILTDCHMPEMDGYDLARAVRAAEAEADGGGRIPIVAITASTLQGDAEKCYAAGMDDVLMKPIELERLREGLARWMPAAAAAPAGSGPAGGPADPTPPADDGDAPVDPSALAALVGDDPELIRGLLKDFVQPSWSCVREIEDAVSRHAPDDVGRAAHKLKSSSRAVGAHALAELCLDLEQAGKAGDWPRIEAGAPRLHGLMDAIAAYVEAI